MAGFNPEHWRTLNALLDEVLDLPEDRRRGWMEELRARDAVLASDLQSLLDEHQALKQEKFLDQEVGLPVPAMLAGQTLGPYTLLSPLGQGGMGEVWLAEQRKPVHRKVAIKVIKHGMDTAQVVARFEAERQALALMDHTCVAKVFEAGSTPQGRPYFVMEYVRGVSLMEHCDSHKLTTRERLELFMQVCDGVQHAHQKAVIHRDLKPSNVLVTLQDGKAIPKIIDFGVAKATAQRLTERTLYTGLGVLIGTPEYMSPEQANLTGQDVDTRTDVYSLGVMLYELLSGMLPFDAATFRQGGFDDIRRRIREEEPKTPSARLSALGSAAAAEIAVRRQSEPATLRRQLKGELDWIAMKALEKDRLRRYGSAAELSADIGRYLDNLPVVAGPPGAGYRARKFVRRHRVGVAFAGLGVAGLLAFALAMAYQTARTARERDRANREATTANRALSVLTELFEVSDPSEARGNSITAREILDRGAGKIDKDLADEPLIRAKLYLTLGLVYQSLGLNASSKPLLEQSVALRRTHLGEENVDTLESMNALAGVLQDQGQLADAEKLFRDVLRARKIVLGPDNADTLESANNLGLILHFEGNLKEAEVYTREALEGKRRTLGPDDPALLPTMNNLGLLLNEEGKPAEAEPYLREVLEKCRRTIGNDHPHTLTAINNMGLVLVGQGKLAEAEPFWREALETRTRVFGKDHPQTLLSMQNLAYLLRLEDKVDEAMPLSHDSLDGLRRALGPEHPRTLTALNGMALLLQAQGKLQESEADARECLAARRKTIGPDHPDSIDSLQALASILQQENKLAEAEALLREASDRGREKLGPDHPQTLNAIIALGDVETSQGRLKEAEPMLAQALADARRALPPGHRAIAKALCCYGRCLAAIGRYPEAEASLLESRAIFQKTEPASLPRVEKSLTDLYALWGRAPGAPGKGHSRPKDPVISFTNVSKQYGSQVLFVEASFQLNPGERAGLVGPNGAGKTTVFRMITGEETPDDGEVTVPRKLTIGYFRQDVEEMSGRSVLDEAIAGSGRVGDLHHELESLQRGMADPARAAEMDAILERFGEVQEEYDHLGGYALESRAREVLHGLGFDDERIDGDVGALSGGWKMRVAMARVLLGRPDVLLMDEPTNHLDIESIVWLESFLKSYPGTLLITSHDREFLNRIVSKIAEIDGGEITVYSGDYDFYDRERRLRETNREAAYSRQQAMLAKEQRFIDRFRTHAAKAAQVQSRIKALDKIEKVTLPKRRTLVTFDFRNPPRSGDQVAVLEDVHKTYGRRSIYEGLSLTIRRGERWAVMGRNGAGKTTLLRIVAGVLAPDSGSVRLGAALKMGYFAQQSLDVLRADLTVIEQLQADYPLEGIGVLRTLAGAFQFTGDDVEKKVRALSGGERSRLAMARMLFDTPNFLVLDEPTNHLDMATKEMLVESLRSFEGTMLFVSHDRTFLRGLGTRVLELGGESGRDSQPHLYPGSYIEYVERTGHEAPGTHL